MVEQFFIKISPNQELVNCGTLKVNKSKTSFNYFIKDNKVDIIEPLEALEWINDSIQKKYSSDAEILFFIHGFWGSLPFAIHRTAKEFQKSYFKNEKSKTVAIVHIVWDTNDINYKNSILNISKSSLTLSKVFNSIPSKIQFTNSLMCHSMGNRFLHETLTKQTVEVHFKKLILMAPDLDYRKYESSFSLFAKLADSVIVFYHKKDKTLKMSKSINKIERLGRLNKSDIAENIQFIDCTSIRDIKSISDSVMKHLYFITSATVKNQIETILND
jgi:esterase/lipase superfamily enzyme